VRLRRLLIELAPLLVATNALLACIGEKESDSEGCATEPAVDECASCGPDQCCVHGFIFAESRCEDLTPPLPSDWTCTSAVLDVDGGSSGACICGETSSEPRCEGNEFGKVGPGCEPAVWESCALTCFNGVPACRCRAGDLGNLFDPPRDGDLAIDVPACPPPCGELPCDGDSYPDPCTAP